MIYKKEDGNEKSGIDKEVEQVEKEIYEKRDKKEIEEEKKEA